MGNEFYFYNCHQNVIKYTKNHNFICNIPDSIKGIINKEHPIVLSSLNKYGNRSWWEEIKSIRRAGLYNFIVIVSFEKQDAVFGQLQVVPSGIGYLRLPFKQFDLSSLHDSFLDLSEESFTKLQQQLCREHVFSALPKLGHGNKLDFANRVFVPLRAALVLNTTDEQKVSLVSEILNSGVKDYWLSEEMTELTLSVKNFMPLNHSEELLKELFLQTEHLIDSLLNISINTSLSDFIDTIDSCTRSLWVLTFLNTNPG